MLLWGLSFHLFSSPSPLQPALPTVVPSWMLLASLFFPIPLSLCLSLCPCFHFFTPFHFFSPFLFSPFITLFFFFFSQFPFLFLVFLHFLFHNHPSQQRRCLLPPLYHVKCPFSTSFVLPGTDSCFLFPQLSTRLAAHQSFGMSSAGSSL